MAYKSKQVPGIDKWMVALGEAIQSKSHRVTAIMAAAALEDLLDQLIKSKLKKDQKIFRELFNPDRPLGAFGTKIKLAYLMGLLKDDVYRELDIIRGIRNSFAHDPWAMSLNAAPFRDACMSLKLIELHTRETLSSIDFPSEKAQFLMALENRDEILKSPNLRLGWSAQVLVNYLTNAH